MDDVKSEEDQDASCIKGLSRKEFIERVIRKAAMAGTLAVVVSEQMSVHPLTAQAGGLPTMGGP